MQMHTVLNYHAANDQMHMSCHTVCIEFLRHPWVGGDFFTTESILYYTIDFFNYYRDEFFTTQPISLIHNRILYYTVDFFTTESKSLLQSRILCYRVDVFTAQ